MKATVTDGVGLADRYRRSTELMRAEMNYPEHILHEIINHFVNECERRAFTIGRRER